MKRHTGNLAAELEKLSIIVSYKTISKADKVLFSQYVFVLEHYLILPPNISKYTVVCLSLQTYPVNVFLLRIFFLCTALLLLFSSLILKEIFLKVINEIDISLISYHCIYP